MEIKQRERISTKCIDCNKPFSISPAEQKYFEEKGLMLPKRCRECRENRHKLQEFVCVDCGKTFTMTKMNLNYFKKQGMQPPKRCESCRQDKRERAEYDKQKEENK